MMRRYWNTTTEGKPRSVVMGCKLMPSGEWTRSINYLGDEAVYDGGWQYRPVKGRC